MDYNKLSKSELVEVLTKISSFLEGDGELVPKKNRELKESRQDALENLIGTIPSFLLNSDIFEKNQDIADFAKRLGIVIPSPEKKKREDIIGRIVSAVAKFNKQKISDLSIAVEELKKTDLKKGKSNFFLDWENAINQMKL